MISASFGLDHTFDAPSLHYAVISISEDSEVNASDLSEKHHTLVQRTGRSSGKDRYLPRVDSPCWRPRQLDWMPSCRQDWRTGSPAHHGYWSLPWNDRRQSGRTADSGPCQQRIESQMEWNDMRWYSNRLRRRQRPSGSVDWRCRLSQSLVENSTNDTATVSRRRRRRSCPHSRRRPSWRPLLPARRRSPLSVCRRPTPAPTASWTCWRRRRSCSTQSTCSEARSGERPGSGHVELSTLSLTAVRWVVVAGRRSTTHTTTNALRTAAASSTSTWRRPQYRRR